jgi:hypothetical protein
MWMRDCPAWILCIGIIIIIIIIILVELECLKREINSFVNEIRIPNCKGRLVFEREIQLLI